MGLKRAKYENWTLAISCNSASVSPFHRANANDVHAHGIFLTNAVSGLTNYFGKVVTGA